MRGRTSKLLRMAARLKYMEMIQAGAMNPPDDPSHATYQVRVMYRHLKKAYLNLPSDVRARYLKPLRELRGRRLATS